MIYLVAVVSFLLGVSVSNIIKKKAPKLYDKMCIGCGVPPDDGENG